MHENPWFSVVKSTFNDETFWSVAFHREAVAIIAVAPSGRIGLIQEYRPAISRAVWDIPAGAMEHGELPAQAAVREAQEELGLPEDVFGSPQQLGVCTLSPGSTNQRMHLFKVPLHREAGSPESRSNDSGILEQRWVTLDEARSFLSEGGSSHSQLALALFEREALIESWSASNGAAPH
ncbi:NUDIX hydrolase [Nonomuraea sp. B19D2]|uniref:NUDIX hydrolase n=1 Tax=Nonomuraea sp. B19D2 TaxID=3159561 RepID=UPI0032DB42B2